MDSQHQTTNLVLLIKNMQKKQKQRLKDKAQAYIPFLQKKQKVGAGCSMRISGVCELALA